MRKNLIAFLCGLVAPLASFASNEGVPVYYSNDYANRQYANRNAYPRYQDMGYRPYVGNTGKKQIVSSESYSYQVPRLVPKPSRGAMTTNGVAKGKEFNTSVYAKYVRRFADFEFKTGVNSILEWDDMLFNEIGVGISHVFDIHGFDLLAFADYSYGELEGGGLSMDYDLEPYDYAYPADGIFTISMGDQTGNLNRLRFGIGAHHIWDLGGWKITPQIGYEIFKHNMKMSNHIYPNPGVYLPLMTSSGDYVFGDVDGNYYAVSQDTYVEDDSGLYQICMSPEDVKVVPASSSGSGIFLIGDYLTTTDWNSSYGDLPWGVAEGDCIVIGGDGMVVVDGVTHIYNTTWSGFYFGLEVEKQMTLADKLRFYVQVSMPKYSSEGTWPNRDDWQQNPSFLDEGTNGSFAYSAEMEYTYQLSDRMQISIMADTNYYQIGKIPGELYVAETTIYVEDELNPGNFIVQTQPAYTEHVDESLKKAVWRSYGLHIGLKYAF